MSEIESTDAEPDAEVLAEFAVADSSLRKQQATGQGESFRRSTGLNDDVPGALIEQWRADNLDVTEAPGYPPEVK